MALLKPPGLKPGDTIGFFSSSAATAWAPNRFARAGAFLEGRASDSRRAASPASRITGDPAPSPPGLTSSMP